MRSGTTHSLIAVGAEQASVVAFLHHDVGDAWLILLLKADTGLTDGQQLIIQHLRRNSIKHGWSAEALSILKMYVFKSVTTTRKRPSSPTSVRALQCFLRPEEL